MIPRYTAPLDDAPRSLFGKLMDVAKAVDAVAKKGRNDFHKYDYVTERDVAVIFRNELFSRNLLLFQDEADDAVRDGDVTGISINFTFVDVDSHESYTFTLPGQGQDKGDKGVYKAITGAQKYALLKTFLVPTGDDPEGSDASGASTRRSAAPTSANAATWAKKSAPDPHVIAGMAAVVDEQDEQVVQAVIKIAELGNQNLAATEKWIRNLKNKQSGLEKTVDKMVEKGVARDLIANVLKDVDGLDAFKQAFNATEVV